MLLVAVREECLASVCHYTARHHARTLQSIWWTYRSQLGHVTIAAQCSAPAMSDIVAIIRKVQIIGVEKLALS